MSRVARDETPAYGGLIDDSLRPQAELYRDRLADAGVPVAFRSYAGMIHGYFGLESVFDVSGDAMADAGSALREGLAAGKLDAPPTNPSRS